MNNPLDKNIICKIHCTLITRNTVNFDLGICFISKNEFNDKANIYCKYVPHVSTRLNVIKRHDDSVFLESCFTSTSNEEYIVILARKKGRDPLSDFIIKLNYLEINLLTKKHADLANDFNLIRNGDFEQFHRLNYLNYLHVFEFQNSIPYWNLESYFDQKKILVPSNNLIDAEFSQDGINSKLDKLAFLLGTPDYFIGDSIFKPKYGSACAGLNLISWEGDKLYRGREYLVNELSEDLIKDKFYVVKFYYCFVSKILGHFSSPSNYLGVCLSDSIIYKNSIIETEYPLSLSHLSIDSIPSPFEWVEFKMIFKANGGEKFFYIGDFKEDNKLIFHTSKNSISYVLIDNVSISPLYIKED